MAARLERPDSPSALHLGEEAQALGSGVWVERVNDAWWVRVRTSGVHVDGREVGPGRHALHDGATVLVQGQAYRFREESEWVRPRWAIGASVVAVLTLVVSLGVVLAFVDPFPSVALEPDKPVDVDSTQVDEAPRFMATSRRNELREAVDEFIRELLGGAAPPPVPPKFLDEVRAEILKYGRERRRRDVCHIRQVKKALESRLHEAAAQHNSRFETWNDTQPRPSPAPTLERRRRASVLSYLAWVESGRAAALGECPDSSAKARGVWQFIARTGAKYGLRRRGRDLRCDIDASTQAAVDYVEDLYELCTARCPLLILAGYNMNPRIACAEEHVAGCPDLQFHVLTEMRVPEWRDGSMPDETRTYVPRILAAFVVERRTSWVNQLLRDEGLTTLETDCG